MLKQAKKQLHALANAKKAATFRGFFKNCVDDVFLGVPAKEIKNLAKVYHEITMPDLHSLMQSDVHEERSLAHTILRIKYDKGDAKQQQIIYRFYLKHRSCIRDWDGVDDSAPYIVGKHLLNKDAKVLYTLAKSKHLWSRRIAIVSTWWFIRNQQLDHTYELSKILLRDKEDLIHKAVGWMLREAGKRDEKQLKQFLNKHHDIMPRTMLRYAIEKFSATERMKYLRSRAGASSAKRG